VNFLSKLVYKCDPLDELVADPSELATLKAWHEGYSKGSESVERGIGGRSQTRLPCGTCHKDTVHGFVSEPENLVYCFRCGARNYKRLDD
jgi:hypothetical protein